MSIIDTLVTNRTEQHVAKLKEILSKPMSEWTEDEADYFWYGGEPLYATDGILSATDGVLYANDGGDGIQRGAYNATDLNRVGQACIYLIGLIASLGYDTSAYAQLRTNWSVTDVPTAAEMATYLATIARLKAQFSAVQDIPSTMNALTYQGANCPFGLSFMVISLLKICVSSNEVRLRWAISM